MQTAGCFGLTEKAYTITRSATDWVGSLGMRSCLRWGSLWVIIAAVLIPWDSGSPRSDTMTSHPKISPDLTTLLTNESPAMADTVSAFVLLTGNLTSDQEKTLKDLGVKIGTRAGDVLTCEIPLGNLSAAAELQFIKYVEGSRPLHYDMQDKED